jgi:hypothetical protein
MTENTNKVEAHGCIVCAKLFNVFAVYSPGNKLIDCKVTSPGGHCVADDEYPLVACDIHTQKEISASYNRWLARNGSCLMNDDD